MSSPTVIRHAVINDTAGLVVTYTERSRGVFTFLASFQTYKVHENHATTMIKDRVWTTEAGAIKLFDQWMEDNA